MALRKLLDQWQLPYRPLMGAEIEFYALAANGEPVTNLLALFPDNTQALIAETGLGQYEYRTQPLAPLALAEHLCYRKQELLTQAAAAGYSLDFRAKPFADQPGSGLHLHCSLLNDAGHNLFETPPTITDNIFLQQAIGGILSSLPGFMHYLCPTPACYQRFDTPDIHTPTTLSWGGNNRSAALRIPDDNPQNRRIELRVASPEADPHLAIATMLYGIEQGICRQLTPPPRSYGIAQKENAPALSRTLEEALQQKCLFPLEEG